MNMPECEISFSTLGCPDWTVSQIVDMAVRARYSGVELRFVQGESSLWKLPAFQNRGLQQTRSMFAGSGLAISCVDTSCRFDAPNFEEREQWIEEGVRMAELAAELNAPGIRVFGDRVQEAVVREQARAWVHDSIARLSDKTSAWGVEVWLETHGDFSSTKEVLSTLPQRNGVGVVWDAASAFVESGERPMQNGGSLAALIRHVHLKDLRRNGSKWVPALTGEGEFPLKEVRSAVKQIGYAGFLSFEWEKKWHPEIEPPEIAIPHFANWFRESWQRLDGAPDEKAKRGAPH